MGRGVAAKLSIHVERVVWGGVGGGCDCHLAARCQLLPVGAVRSGKVWYTSGMGTLVRLQCRRRTSAWRIALCPELAPCPRCRRSMVALELLASEARACCQWCGAATEMCCSPRRAIDVWSMLFALDFTPSDWLRRRSIIGRASRERYGFTFEDPIGPRPSCTDMVVYYKNQPILQRSRLDS